MLPVSEPLLAGNELEYVQTCLKTGWISSAGEFIERFERAWAEYCGVSHGIAVSNGTVALQVAVDALGLSAGDEVIIPSFTIISCALAILRCGLKPVVVDCDPDTWCMDVQQVRRAISPRTRAIMTVHMYGHPVNADELSSLAEERELAIIEDAAEAHGSEYLSTGSGKATWRRCGSLGTLSAFSFFANKVVTTGEGGMVLTNNVELAQRCRSLRNLCFLPQRFHHEELGYNFRLTNLQAAIGVAQVERINETLALKRRMGGLYDRLLTGVPGLQLQAKRPYARVNYWMYGVVLDDSVSMDAALFAARLKDRGIETRPFFKGMHEQPALHAQGLFRGMSLPVTERLARRGLYLPSSPSLTEAQVEFVASSVKELLA